MSESSRKNVGTPRIVFLLPGFHILPQLCWLPLIVNLTAESISVCHSPCLLSTALLQQG